MANFALVAVCCIALTKSSSVKPNIVFFFADNLGYSDIGVFGAPSAKTPNVDRLAIEGIKLNNWNSIAAFCSPSRSALLTGRYPVRTGTFPNAFPNDATYGLPANETTIAEYLKLEGYATSIVGKWHLGQRDQYLPTRRGFDEWFGLPYEMMGGSFDGHICGVDKNASRWMPLFYGNRIIEQPANLTNLAPRLALAATDFVHRSVKAETPFFLYVAFPHVHQKCPPKQVDCQWASHLFSNQSPHATFIENVQEMDWITGQILASLDKAGIENETLVIWTSDNGPWVSEQRCAGSKGPFVGQWLLDNVQKSCTACPSGCIQAPLPDRPRRCMYPGTSYEMDGIHCGADSGLGSSWEANVRMPALARWPGRIPAGTESMVQISTLDVLPTLLHISNPAKPIPSNIDGKNAISVLTLPHVRRDDQPLFFWRDGFGEGPLPQPFGSFKVVAMKLGRFKAWFWTKSGHYNPDPEVEHEPPLLFDIIADPAEAFPLNSSTSSYSKIIDRMYTLRDEHVASTGSGVALGYQHDSKYFRCSDPENHCRTSLAPDTSFRLANLSDVSLSYV